MLLVSANREQLPSPVVPIGLLYVASALRDRHEVELCDLCFAEDPLATVREAVRSFRPDVVGLGLRNLHENSYTGGDQLIDYYADLARAIRSETSAPLVLGGGAITLQPSSLLERLGASHAVIGEAERTFRELVDALARGETPERLVYGAAAQTSGAKGIISLTTRAGVRHSDLDELAPPARDLIDPRYYAIDGTDNVQTKRGCAFQCAYCDYPDLEGRKVRVRNPEAVADELVARSKASGVTHAFLVDSVFNVPRSHALAVCDALVQRGVPLPWVCYATPASMDEEVARAMARAGCVGVEVGADSGTPRVLERLRKPFDIAQVRRARAAFRDAGIADCHTFVLGAEGETVEEARGTLEFIDELDPDVAMFVVFMEDREERGISRAEHREALLDLLTREAPKRPGWVVPELAIRFGGRLAQAVRRQKLMGPSWLHLARSREGRARG
ncbi:MAG: cobalamin-dependent protein [Myxococcota bacterium]|nr:cobalamin-dependent protein [Myxococcota bacterium]